jgi:hypothetical protein
MTGEFSEVDFFVNSNGVTVFCLYFTTPRFIPFDIKGRCSMCKCDSTDIDYVIQSQGITIYCPRLKKEKYLRFDLPSRFHSGSSVRVRSRGRVYTVPLSQLDVYQQESGLPEDMFPPNPLFPPPPPPSLPPTLPPQEGLGGVGLGGEGLGVGGPPPPPQPGPEPGPGEMSEDKIKVE